MDKGDAIDDADLCEALANCVEMAAIDLASVTITPEVLNMVPAHFAREYGIVPISFTDNTLVLAMADPANVFALDDLKFVLNTEVRGAICSEEQLRSKIEKYYPE